MKRPMHDLFPAADIYSLSLCDNALFNPQTTEQTNWYTAPSDSSVASAESIAASVSKIRRRRRGRKVAPTSIRRSNQERRRYQCTFCTDAFKTKHDWQRHERALHLSLDQWHCLRFGPTVMNSDGTVHCVFCGDQNPTTAHVEMHGYSNCAAKSAADRVFFRKDHLLQHLRQVHNGCKFNERMMSWISTIYPMRSRCGFCDLRMTTWVEREKHLADHFKSGSDMKEWTGDHGFDPEIENLVRDDMPPYMIGQQRETVEPFSASRPYHCVDPESSNAADQETSDGLTPSPDLGHNVHSYRHIERQLLAYVSREISQGRVPSDFEIRR